jgi:YD repeat-containing protein
MIDFIVGSGLGRFNFSGSEDNQSSSIGQGADQLSLNLRNGNLLLQRRDQILTGASKDINMTRSYNSFGHYNQHNPDNFRFSFEQRIFNTNGRGISHGHGTITRRSSDGSESIFERVDAHSNVYQSSDGAGAHDTLTFNHSTHEWIFTEGSSQKSDIYDKHGRLIGSLDAEGTANYSSLVSAAQLKQLEYKDRNQYYRATLYFYDHHDRVSRIEDASGQKIEIEYQEDPHSHSWWKSYCPPSRNIVALKTTTADGSSTLVRYEYDDLDRMTKAVTDLSPDDNNTDDGNVYETTYTYHGDSNRLATLVQSDGTRAAFTYVYDDEDCTYKTKSIRLGEGEESVLYRFDYYKDQHRTDSVIIEGGSYDPVGDSELVSTTGIGSTTSYFYDEHNRLVRELSPVTEAGQRLETQYEYDSDDNLTALINAEGNRTEYFYDAQGNQVEIREASGATLRRVFNEHNQVTAETSFELADPDGSGQLQPREPLTTRYFYDDNQRIRFVIDPKGNVTEHRYDYSQDLAHMESKLTYAHNLFDISELNALKEQTLTDASSSALIEIWDDIWGHHVGDLTHNPNYPNNPDQQIVASALSFEDMGWHTGARVRSYIHPTVSGYYNFHLTSDGASELWLSKDDHIANAKQIAYTHNSGRHGHHDRSGATWLEAGETYYLETIYKEHRSADYLKVEWCSDEVDLEVIGGENLSFSSQWINEPVTTADIEAWIESISDFSKVERTDSYFDDRGLLAQMVKYNQLDAQGNGLADGHEMVSLFTYDQANRLIQSIDAKGKSDQIIDGVFTPAYTHATGTEKGLIAEYYHGTNFESLQISEVVDGINFDAGYGSIVDGLDHNHVSARFSGQIAAAHNVGVESYEFYLNTDQGARLYIDGVLVIDQWDGWFSGGMKVGCIDLEAGKKYDIVVEYKDTRGQSYGELAWESDSMHRQLIRSSYFFHDPSAVSNASQPIDTANIQAHQLGSMEDITVSNFAYDGMGRLMLMSDNKGNNSTFMYDDANQTIVRQSSEGLTTTQMFDSKGQLVSRVESSNEFASVQSATGQTDFQYDRKGRLVWTQDPTGVRRFNIYDRLGRQIAMVDGTGAITEYKYNGSHQKAVEIQYAQRIDLANIDTNKLIRGLFKLNTIRPQDNDNDRYIQTVYDSSDREIFKVDGEGTITETRYRGDHFVSEKIIYDLMLFADSESRLTESDVRSAIETAYAQGDLSESRREKIGYNVNNTVLFEIDQENFLTEYVYDSANRLIETIQYAEQVFIDLQTLLSDEDLLAAIRPSSNDSDIRKIQVYNNLGQMAASISAEGVVTEYQYNTSNQVTTVITFADTMDSAELSSLIANAGGLDQLTLELIRPDLSAQDQVLQNQYDSAGLLSQFTNAENTVEQYAYDNAGNLIQTIENANNSSARITRSIYNARGDVVSEASARVVAENANALQHIYDDAGRRIKTIDELGHNFFMFYNAEGQILFEVNHEGEVTQSSYNAFGERTQITQFSKAINMANLTGGLDIEQVTSQLVSDSQNDSVVTFEYNRRGDQIKITDAENFQTSMTVNAFGQVELLTEQVTDSKVVKTLFDYDNRGFQIQISRDIEQLNISKFTQYDAFGRVISAVDGNGQVTRYEYDRQGRVLVVEQPNLAKTHTSYDAFARVLSETDALGHTTTFQYSDTERSITITSPEGIQTKIIHNEFGEEVAVIDGNNNQTNYHYNENGELVKIVDAENKPFESEFDLVGNLIRTVDQNHIETIQSYDAANRLTTRIVDPSGLAIKTEYFYDRKGQIVVAKDANGVQTNYEYDLNGEQIKQVVDPTGLALTTEIQYDGLGNQVAILQGDSGGTLRETHYQYDNLRRLIAEIKDPANSAIRTAFSYDSNDNMIRRTDANTAQNYFVYDANNRVIYEISAEGDLVEFSYDNAGKKVKTIVFATQLSLSDVELNSPNLQQIIEVAKISSNADQVTHNIYNSDHQLAYTVNSLGELVGYFYDNNGNLKIQNNYYLRVEDLGINVLTKEAIEAALALQPNEAFAHDLLNLWSYDKLNRTTSYTNALGQSESYVFDGVGNVIEKKDRSQLLYTYSYDAANRLVQETTPARNILKLDGTTQSVGQNTQYQYDKLDNIIAKIEAVGTEQQRKTSYAYDSNSRLTTEVIDDGGLNRQLHYQYNSVGDTLAIVQADGTTNYQVFDAAGRVKFDVSATGSIVQYGYDGVGNQVETTHYFNQVDLSLIQTINDSSISAAIQSHSLDRVASAQYDGLQRVIAETDGENHTRTIKYDSFGNRTSSVQGERKTFQVYDELNRVAFEIDAENSVVTFEYDTFGNLIATTQLATAYTGSEYTESAISHFVNNFGSTNDQSTYFFYDDINRITATIDAEGYVTQTFYDARDNVTLETRFATALSSDDIQQSVLERHIVNLEIHQNDRSTHYSYNALDSLISTTDYLGLTTSKALDGFDRANQTVLSDGLESRLSSQVFNALGEVVQQRSFKANQENAQQWMQSHYDTNGRMIAQTDQLGNKTFMFYDADDRLVHTVNALGEVKSWSYNSFGEVQQSVEHATRVSTSGLTGGTNLSQIESLLVSNVDDRTTTFEFDQRGLLINETDASQHTTQFAYNQFGEMTTKTRQVNQTATRTDTFAYDLRGLQTASIADLGAANINQTTTNVYDIFGRLTAATDANGNTTSMHYDKLGRMVSAQQGGLSPIHMSYDAFSREITVTDALGQATTASYNDDTKTSIITSAEGVVTKRVINAFGELVSFSDAISTTTYEYDADGNLTKVSMPLQASEQSVYDLLGRKIQTIDPEGVVREYHYDAIGRLLTETVDPSGLNLVTQYDYNAFGNEIKITDANQVETHARFDARNNKVSMLVDPNGISNYTEFSYDGLNNQLSVARGTAQGSIDQITSKTIAAQVHYEYDHLNRLKAESGDTIAVSYVYDQNDNVVVKKDGNLNTTYYIYDASNRLTHTIDAQGYVQLNQYNDNGTLVESKQFNQAVSNLNDIISNTVNGNYFQKDDIGLLNLTDDVNADRLSYSIYDQDNRLVFDVDHFGYVVEYRYNDRSQVIKQLTYQHAINVSSGMSVADVKTQLTGQVFTPATYTASNGQGTLLIEPEGNTYSTINGVLNNLRTLLTDTVSLNATTSIQSLTDATPNQPYSLVTFNQTNTSASASTSSTVQVSNASDVQTTGVVRSVYAPIPSSQSGVALFSRTASANSWSINGVQTFKQSFVDQIADITATSVKAVVLDESGSQIHEITTPLSITVTEGTGDDAQDVTYTASWNGEVNIGQLATDTHYKVHFVVEYVDAGGTVGTYDTRDNNGLPLEITLGQPNKQPTVVTWDSALQPANSDVIFKYMPTGQTASNELSVAAGANSISISNLVDGTYDYQVIYKDRDSGEVLRKMSGSFIEQDGSSRTYTSSLDAYIIDNLTPGDSFGITGYLPYSQLDSISHVDVTVVNKADGSVVSQVRTSPLEQRLVFGTWDGSINLTSPGTTLADGQYEVTVSTTDLSGNIVTDPSFTYEVGLQDRTSQVIQWPSTEPSLLSNGQVKFSSGVGTEVDMSSATSVTVSESGGNYQVSISDTLDPSAHWFHIEYQDGFGHVTAQSSGTFVGKAHADATTSAINISFDEFSISSSAEGTSIANYLTVVEGSKVERISVEVFDASNNLLVSTADTFVSAQQLNNGSFDGALNLSAGATLADGHYNIVATLHYLDGTTETKAGFNHQIGSVSQSMPLTTINLGAVTLPENTSLKAHYDSHDGNGLQSFNVSFENGSLILKAPEISANLGHVDVLFELIDQVDGGVIRTFSNELVFNNGQGRLQVADTSIAGDAIVTTRVYDALNRVTQVDTGGLDTTIYRYDLNDNVTEIQTDNTLTTKSYDKANRQIQESNGSAVESMTYDANGNITSKTQANGFTTYYIYDELNRKTHEFTPLSVEFNNGVNGSVFDGQGFNSNSNTYRLVATEYNALDQVAVEKLYQNSVTLTAADANNLADGNVLTSLSNLTANQAFKETVKSYHDSGLLANELVKGYDGSVLRLASYEYDANGNQTADNVARNILLNSDGSANLDTAQYSIENINRTERMFDTKNQVVRETMAAGTMQSASSLYAYNGYGEIVETISANAQSLIESNETWAQEKRTSLGYPALIEQLSDAQKLALLTAHKSTIFYDQRGLKIAETDAIGNTRTFEYDARGNMIKTTDAEGQSGFFYYDDLGRSAAFVNPKGYATENSYDAEGNLLKQTQVAKALTAETYHEMMSLNAITRKIAHAKTVDDRTTIHTYDSRNNKLSTTDALGETEFFAYDLDNNLVKHTNKKSQATYYLYDADARKVGERSVEISGNSGSESGYYYTQMEYNHFNQVVKLSRLENGSQTYQKEFAYDAMGQNSSITDGGQVIERAIYDLAGNKVVHYDGKNQASYYYFNSLNQQHTSVDAAGYIATVQYDAQGNAIETNIYQTAVNTNSLSASNGPSIPAESDIARSLRYTFNEANQLIETKGSDSLTFAVGDGFSETANSAKNYYDANGLNVRTVDALGNETRYIRNELGEVSYIIDATGAVVHQEYNAYSQVVKRTQYANKLTHIFLRSLNDNSNDALISAEVQAAASTSDRVVEYEYDQHGQKTVERIVGMGNAAVSLNGNGAPLSVAANAQTDLVIAMAYDAEGNVTSHTRSAYMTGTNNKVSGAPELVTTFTYDHLNRLIEQSNPEFTDYQGAIASQRVQYNYNFFGNITKEAWLNRDGSIGKSKVFGFDNRGRLESELGYGGHYSYSYDANNNITSISDLKRNVNIVKQYNAQNIVYQETFYDTASGNNVFQKHSYFSYNAYGKMTGRGFSFSQSQPTLNQEFWTYDGNGNVLTTNENDGVIKHYAYDQAGNRTITIKSIGTSSIANQSITQLLDTGSNDDLVVMVNRYNDSNQIEATYSTNSSVKGSLGDTLRSILGSENRYDYAFTSTQSEYNAFREQSSFIDAKGNQTQWSYNAYGSTVAEYSATISTYTSNGRASTETPVKRWYYDVMGRQVATRDANGNLSVTAYNGEMASAAISANGDTRSMAYDALGDLRTEISALGWQTNYSHAYNTIGKVVSAYHGVDGVKAQVADAYMNYGTTTHYQYDFNQRLLRTTDGIGSESYQYDALGRLLSFTNKDNRTTHFSYEGLADGSYIKQTTDLLGKISKEKVNAFGLKTESTLLHNAGTTGRRTTFVYNQMNGLVSETSDATNIQVAQGGSLAVGQKSISYTYYTNGMKKSITDVTSGTTTYKYDSNNNVIEEAFSNGKSGGDNLYVKTTATYDSHNRWSSVRAWITEGSTGKTAYNLNYTYDAHGNRLRINGTSKDGNIDHWYAYDQLNRSTTSQGNLSGGSITGGITLGYDAANRRVSETINGVTTSYNYRYQSSDNTYHVEVDQNGVRRGNYKYDSRGRALSVDIYGTNGTSDRVRNTTYEYSGSNYVLETANYYGQYASNNKKVVTGKTFDVMGNLLSVSSNSTPNEGANTITSTNYTYAMWEGYIQRVATISGSNSDLNGATWNPGRSTSYFNANGVVTSAVDSLAGTKTYDYDTGGRVIRRSENNTKVNQNFWHQYFYLGGKLVNDQGNDGTSKDSIATQIADEITALTSDADRTTESYQNSDQNLSQPNFGSSANLYTVKSGETLKSIAKSQFGDENLWFILADVNGMQGGSPLFEGQTLNVPNMLAAHNTANEIRSYDSGETLRDLSPTLPDAPPPKEEDKDCAQIALIIITVVVVVIAAIAVTVVTAGVAAGGAGVLATAAIGAVVGAAAGAASSAIIQGSAIGLGLQEEWSWEDFAIDVALGAVGGAISGASAAFTVASKAATTANAVGKAAQTTAKTASTASKFVKAMKPIAMSVGESVVEAAASDAIRQAIKPGAFNWSEFGMAVGIAAATPVATKALKGVGKAVFTTGKKVASKVGTKAAALGSYVGSKAAVAGRFVGRSAVSVGKATASGVVKAGKFVAKGAVAAGKFVGRGALYVGGKIADVGRYIGTKAVAAKNALFNKNAVSNVATKAAEPGLGKRILASIKSGASTTANRVASAGRFIGQSAVSASKYVGRNALAAAQYVGRQATTAGKFVAEKTVTAAKFVGRNVANGAQFAASKVKSAASFVGRNVVSAGKYVGGKVVQFGSFVGQKALAAKNALFGKKAATAVIKDVSNPGLGQRMLAGIKSAGSFVGTKIVAAGKFVGRNAVAAAKYISNNAVAAGKYIGAKAAVTGQFVGRNAVAAGQFFKRNAMAAASFVGRSASDAGSWLFRKSGPVGRGIVSAGRYVGAKARVANDYIASKLASSASDEASKKSLSMRQILENTKKELTRKDGFVAEHLWNKKFSLPLKGLSRNSHEETSNTKHLVKDHLITAFKAIIAGGNFIDVAKQQYPLIGKPDPKPTTTIATGNVLKADFTSSSIRGQSTAHQFASNRQVTPSFSEQQAASLSELTQPIKSTRQSALANSLLGYGNKNSLSAVLTDYWQDTGAVNHIGFNQKNA